MCPDLRHHRRGEEPRKHHAGTQVHVERPVDLLDREAVEAPGGRDARVGDQDINLARLFGEAPGLAGAGEIGRNHLRFTELLRELAERVGIASRQDELRALAMQPPCDMRTKTGRCACEQDRLAAELHGRRICRG